MEDEMISIQNERKYINIVEQEQTVQLFSELRGHETLYIISIASKYKMPIKKL